MPSILERLAPPPLRRSLEQTGFHRMPLPQVMRAGPNLLLDHCMSAHGTVNSIHNFIDVALGADKSGA